MADSTAADARMPQCTMGVVEAGNEPGDLRCCCGKEDCVYLRHNCSVLSSVERDVHTAARMGQSHAAGNMAEVEIIWRSRQPNPDDSFPSLTFTLQTLLVRHEAYMASAERDRLELTARIEQLERDNAELEHKNQSVTEENDVLREELEQINDTVKQAETRMELLEATLLDSQREVRRLENATERAASLERQIALLEEEQVVLRTTIARTEEEARTTVYRWRQAEKGLSDLQEQLERMEKEAREERERHVEVIGRMERQRAMEKELNTAAGRLKGAAVVKSMSDSRNSSNVVSHFVRDLLQDNANLQVGMADLREMLLSSNDEIQMLREQLMYHQPATGHEPSAPTTLHAELASKEPPTSPQPAPRVSQELHIHHHYHVSHKADTRKPRKRRQGLTPGTFTPPQFSAPASPVMTSARFQRGVLPGALLSPPSNDPSVSSGARWSLQPGQPDFAPSSAPSSPRSTNRDSIFDRVPDLPSPASPTTSVDPTSPGWKTAHRKKVSEFSLRSISETAMLTDASRPPACYPPRPHPLTHFIMSDHSAPAATSPYTTDDVPSIASPSLGYTDYDSATDAAEETLSPTSSHFDPNVEQRPRGLRRVISHESIMSLSNGMDIHTLKARPSQLSLRPLGHSPAGTDVSVVTAQPTLLSGSVEGKRGSVILRDSITQTLAAPKRAGGRIVSNPVRGRGKDRAPPGQDTPRAPSALGKLVAWRPWGGGGGGGGGGNADIVKADASSPGTSPTSAPLLTAAAVATLAVAVPAISATANMNAGSGAADITTSISTGTTPTATVTTTTNTLPTPTLLGKSPQGSFSSSTATATSSAASAAAANAANAANAAALAAVFRAPGINQPGAVPGFTEYWASAKRKGAPSKVAVEDPVAVQEALREVLEEE